MSTEKTSVTLKQLVEQFNDELKKKEPSEKVLAAMEKEFTAKSSDLAKEIIANTLDSFLAYQNPMVELARTLEVSVPCVKVSKNKDTGARESAKEDTRKVQLPASKLTEMLGKYGTKDGFVAKGVIECGSSWETKAELFCKVLAMSVAKDIDLNSEDQKRIKDGYKLSDKAKTEVMAKDPTSKSQMVKALQDIIDAMVWVDSENGVGNRIHVTSKDVEFLRFKFTGKDSKNAKAVKVAKGKNILDYILHVVHCQVTGESYQLSGVKYEDGCTLPEYKRFRDPLPETAKREMKTEAKAEAAA